MGLSQFDEKDAREGTANISGAGFLTDVQVLQGMGNTYRIDEFFAWNNDAIDHNLVFKLSPEVIDPVEFGPVVIPALSGTSLVPVVDLLAAVGWTPGCLRVTPGAILSAHVNEALGDGATVWVYAGGGTV